jgi:hypothetical protein
VCPGCVSVASTLTFNVRESAGSAERMPGSGDQGHLVHLARLPAVHEVLLITASTSFRDHQVERHREGRREVPFDLLITAR